MGLAADAMPCRPLRRCVCRRVSMRWFCCLLLLLWVPSFDFNWQLDYTCYRNYNFLLGNCI